MVADKRGIAFFIALATTTSHHDCCDAFTTAPLFPLTIQQQQPPKQSWDGIHGGILAPLRAFPSDYYEEEEYSTPETQVQMQNDHFVVSKTTSTFSEPAVGTIAPPAMARPSTETKTNEHALTQVAAATHPQSTTPIWEREKPVTIQGGSQRTWSFVNSRDTSMVQVHMRTEGNPMYANVHLWQGPGNTPQKIKLYSEDGLARPFRCFLPIPSFGGRGGYSNSVNIRNTASPEFPLQAILEGSGSFDPETREKMKLVASAASPHNNRERMVQGGSTITERFQPNVKSLQVFVSSEGRPINCRIELVSGPNNVKQVMEVYSDEGMTRPFYAILETPGFLGGTLRVINCATIEFPFSTIVAPWDVVSKREMHQHMNQNLGGTSSPFRVHGSDNPTFGNVVAQMGGFNHQGIGGFGAVAPKTTKRFVPPAVSSADNNTAGKKPKRKLPPIENTVHENKKIPPNLNKDDGQDDNDDNKIPGSTERILMDKWDKKLEDADSSNKSQDVKTLLPPIQPPKTQRSDPVSPRSQTINNKPKERKTKFRKTKVDDARAKAKAKAEAAADAKTIVYDTNPKASKSNNKKQLDFIDVDLDMECAINEDNNDIECSVDEDIEARIEAEVERKLKESKIAEEKKRIEAEAKAATAAAAALEESIRKEKELKAKELKEKELKERIEAEAKAKELKEKELQERIEAEAKARFEARVLLKEKELKERMEAEAKAKELKEKELQERVEAEAKARFEARVLKEQNEIESKKKEIERINTEMKEMEARLRRSAKEQEEIAQRLAATAQSKPQRQAHRRTQMKKHARLVLDIDDAFK